MIGNKKMIKNIFKNNQGVTLMELLVSVSVFSVIMVSTGGIFQMVVEGQRNAVAAQNVQENIRFAFEMMGKEMRMAQRDDGACGHNGYVYYSYNDDTSLDFVNQYGQCVTYFLADDRLKIDRDGSNGYVTADEIRVYNLEFSVDESNQPSVTMKMDVEAVGKENNKQPMKMQTTITSRVYE